MVLSIDIPDQSLNLMQQPYDTHHNTIQDLSYYF